ncbi:conserved membrane protein of unknown function [Nitrospira sp. KM1]|uniref:hypothetical protein n=1 Tax=Nitrospira sp. KM1 TaxID=1936990 RepID=UPI0013A76933|nr:hypothetical protein [Nitrospira sp. KM1]BCA56538.1 conserved membrane protein of unknown function [Nitrospira sp. KM1]
MEVERTIQQWSVGSTRIKWGAVFAGWSVGLATQMMLTLLGLAIGAWSIDLRDPQATDGIPMGTGVWTGISMLISAFVGGYVTARGSGSYVRTDGLYHGIVVWGVNWLIFAWLTTTAMSYLAGGLFSALGTTVQAMSRGVSEATSAAISQTSGIAISTDELKKQVESVMQATGKKELQPSEVRKDADKVRAEAQSGQSPQQITDAALSELQQKLAALDRNAAVNIMVNKFGMTEPQARQLVQMTIGIAGPIKQKAEEIKQQSAEVGTKAINRVGTIAIWLFALALVTLGLSAAGGIVGTSEDGTVETHGASYTTDVRPGVTRTATT